MSRFYLHLLVVFAVGFIAACDKKQTSRAGDGPDEKVVVVATTTMLADMVRQLGGDDVEVVGIMKPGGDPHLYQPRPSDARSVASAHVVVTNGLHLEGWIDDLVENAGGEEKAFIVAGEVVEPIRMESSPGGVDPHFWFDVGLWKKASDHVAQGLKRAVGEESAEAERIEERRIAYGAELDRLDAWVRDRLETVPPQNRVLVTSHDAFNYFGEAFEIDVVGIQGISTEQEASQRDIINTVEVVKERGAPAVFVETSVNPRLVEQVGREAGVKVSGPLYSDSLGPADSAAGTYVGMVSENVRIIVEALGGQFAALPSDEDGA